MALTRYGSRISAQRDPKKLEALKDVEPEEPQQLTMANEGRSKATAASQPVTEVRQFDPRLQTGVPMKEHQIDPRGRAGLPAPGQPLPPRVATIDPYGPQADVSDMAGLKQRQEQERLAAQQELAAGKARALQNSAARSGMAGLGLSGGTSALQGDISRTQDRTAVQTMTDLTSRQREEQRAQEDRTFTQQQQLAALNDMEAADGVDYNSDGSIDGRPAQEFIDDMKAEEDLAQWKTTHPVTGDTHDFSNMDLDTDPGSMNEPYQISNAEWDQLQAHGAGLTEVAPTPDGWRRWVDREGVVYVTGKRVGNPGATEGGAASVGRTSQPPNRDLNSNAGGRGASS